jgi:hypothetical protein
MDARTRNEVLKALTTHPGWVYLMAEMENRKAICEHALDGLVLGVDPKTESELFIREALRLRECIACYGEMQQRIRKANAMPALSQYEKAHQDSATTQ